MWYSVLDTNFISLYSNFTTYRLYALSAGPCVDRAGSWTGDWDCVRFLALTCASPFMSSEMEPFASGVTRVGYPDRCEGILKAEEKMMNI